MASLILGPLLRYVGRTQATIWIETDVACTVTAPGPDTPTFEVEGHHYALIVLDDLPEGEVIEYEVELDGEQVWPAPGDERPGSVIRTREGEHQARLVFGSCRVGAPQREPYTPSPRDDEPRVGVDALWAYSRRPVARAVHAVTRRRRARVRRRRAVGVLVAPPGRDRAVARRAAADRRPGVRRRGQPGDARVHPQPAGHLPAARR